MWIARDECGRLGFYELKPERTDYGVWDYLGGGYTEIPQDCYLFPNLKWEDEPIEVEIVSKKFMDMYRLKNAIVDKMLEDEEEMVDIPSEVVDAVDKDLFDLTID